MTLLDTLAPLRAHGNTRTTGLDDATTLAFAARDPQLAEAIHAALASAAAAGRAVVAVCSDFEELFEISDRIVVLRDGQIVLDQPRKHVTQDEVLAASLGSHLPVADPGRHVSEAHPS